MNTLTKPVSLKSDQQPTNTWLAVSCVIAALISSIGKGVWELADPVLASSEAFAAAPPGRRWVYGVLELMKSVGFMAGLVALYRIGTRRGKVTTVFVWIAAAGSVFFAGVWLMMAVTSELTVVYVLGGMWYQMVVPVVLGIAALQAHRIQRWVAIYAIIVGVANSQIFTLLGSARALIVQGVLWLLLGCAIWFAEDRG